MKKVSTMLLAGAAALGLTSASYAADLVIEEPPVEVIPYSIWDGGYIGVFGGFGWGGLDHNPDEEGLCWPDGCDLDLSGWLLGVNAGWNFALNGSGGIVLGVAGDIAWVDLSADDSFDEFGDWESNVNFEGSLRGVLGWDGGLWMPYLTAGISFIDATHWSEFADVEVDVSAVGGTAGVGVAYAVAENLAVDLQYRASWYDEEEIDIGWDDDNPDFGLVTSRFTIGLNWSF